VGIGGVVRVLLVRADGTPDDDGRALRARGLDVTAQAFIEVTHCSDPHAPDRARGLLVAATVPTAWFVVTSAAGVRAIVSILGVDETRRGLVHAQERGARFAAVGPTSAGALRDLGVADVVVPERSHTASALLDLLRPVGPATAVLPRSSIGDSLLPSTLEARGWAVVSQVLYETAACPTPPPAAAQLHAGEFDAVVLRSPSAARAVSQLAGPLPLSTRVIAGGPTTALAARRLGIRVSAQARTSRPESIADAVCEALLVDSPAGPTRTEVHA
jgi:uroporphyrinogen-III synthase